MRKPLNLAQHPEGEALTTGKHLGIDEDRVPELIEVISKIKKRHGCQWEIVEAVWNDKKLNDKEVVFLVSALAEFKGMRARLSDFKEIMEMGKYD